MSGTLSEYSWNIASRLGEHHESTALIKKMSDLNKLEKNFHYKALVFNDHIKASPYDRQSHLEKITDALIEHEGVWSKKPPEFVIEFFNFNSLYQVPNNSKPNHYRSKFTTTFSANLKTLLENIVQNKSTIEN